MTSVGASRTSAAGRTEATAGEAPYELTAWSSPPDCASSDHDLYSAHSLLDPYEPYRTLRDQGGVVFLSRYGLYALPRYDTTSEALRDWSRFSTSDGVMLNEVMHEFMRGTLLYSNPPHHGARKAAITRPLVPRALNGIRSEVTREAQALVERLSARGRFNAATDFAQHLPLTIVANLVGLPPLEKERLLRWAPKAFDCVGPIVLERTRAAFPILGEIGEFIASAAARGDVAEGSWLAGLYRAADEGLIQREECLPMAFDYVGPALDTTISASAAALYLFARFPEQWDRLRERPNLIPNAINEIVRLETPIQAWGRRVTKPVVLDGVEIPTGAQVLVMFGSANRDERRWADPDRFDIERDVAGQLGFGEGEHRCAGANLARMELSALLKALLERVRRIELTGDPVLEVNNTARIWREVPVLIRP